MMVLLLQVPVISYLTSPLLKYAVRAHNKPVHITGSVKETELSAMEPDDVRLSLSDYEGFSSLLRHFSRPVCPQCLQ